MTDYLISETFDNVVQSLALLAVGLGFAIGGVVMVMRKPRELKLFGASLLILVIYQVLGSILSFLDLSFLAASINTIALLLILLAAAFIYMVAVNDYTARQRRVAHIVYGIYGLGIVVATIGISIDVFSLIDEVAAEDVTVARYNPFITLWVTLGLVFLGYQAIHVVVERSRGQIYRSALLGSFGLLVALAGLQYALYGYISDVELLVFQFASGVAATVFWVTVLLHDIPEIRRERSEAVAA